MATPEQIIDIMNSKTKVCFHKDYWNAFQEYISFHQIEVKFRLYIDGNIICLVKPK